MSAPGALRLINRVEPLFVARRGDGGLYVVDGQHRLAAAVTRGDIHQLPCVVTHFDSAEQEARAFVALNQQRKPLSTIELFKAALAAGDPTAIKIRDCLTAAGLKLSNHASTALMKPGHVCNIGGLQRTLTRRGERVLVTSLKVLAAAYPQQVLRYAGSIFPGIAGVVTAELRERAAASTLVERLAAFVGKEAQGNWFRSFAAARAQNINLKHGDAAEQVMLAAWREFRQAQLGQQPLQAIDAGGSASPILTPLKPAETAWCEQCDQRRSGAQAANCVSAFCSLKRKAA